MKRTQKTVDAVQGNISYNFSSLEEISRWASKRGILLPNEGQEGNIRIRGNNKWQIALFRKEDGQIYIFLQERCYAGGAKERDEFVKELMNLGLYPQSLNPYKIPNGKMSNRKLYGLDQDQLADLIEILERHC